MMLAYGSSSISLCFICLMIYRLIYSYLSNLVITFHFPNTPAMSIILSVLRGGQATALSFMLVSSCCSPSTITNTTQLSLTELLYESFTAIRQFQCAFIITTVIVLLTDSYFIDLFKRWNMIIMLFKGNFIQLLAKLHYTATIVVVVVTKLIQ